MATHLAFPVTCDDGIVRHALYDIELGYHRLIEKMLPPVTVLSYPPNDAHNYHLDDNYVHYYNENGVFHRVNGPASISIAKSYGYEKWYNNGKYHRLDGPAVIGNSYDYWHKMWYNNGKQHRLDGPAVITSTGREEYFVNGLPYSKEDFQTAVQKYVDMH